MKGSFCPIAINGKHWSRPNDSDPLGSGYCYFCGMSPAEIRNQPGAEKPRKPRPRGRILRASEAGSKRVKRRLKARRPKPLKPRCSLCGKPGKPGGLCFHTEAEFAIAFMKARKDDFTDKTIPDRYVNTPLAHLQGSPERRP
ncbi:hypothetical protein KAR91_77135 [Candidatus Pacearchaeota archaeon]|nr:hypothetical protein [Candidatus Pacearchaeota archaeon]